MAFPLQSLRVTVVMLSLLLVCAGKVSGMRYTFSDTTGIKHSDFPVNVAPQPSGIIPGQGRFLLPPKPPIAAAPVVAAPVAAPPVNNAPVVAAPIAAAPLPSCETPGLLSPKPAYEAPSPSSREDPVPPVPQP